MLHVLSFLSMLTEHVPEIIVTTIVILFVKYKIDSIKRYLGAPPKFATRLLKKEARTALISIFKKELSIRSEIIEKEAEVKAFDLKKEVNKIKGKYNNKIEQALLDGRLKALKAKEAGNTEKETELLTKAQEKAVNLKAKQNEEIKALKLSRKDQLALLASTKKPSVFKPFISLIYFFISRNDKAKIACHKSFPWLSVLPIEAKIINRKHYLAELEAEEAVDWDKTVSAYMEERIKFY